MFREEVLNVKLAELLSRRGILAVPETILDQAARGRRLPDVTAGQFLGIRVVVEGKTGDKPSVRATLERACRRRLEEGIAAIAIGVIYPPEVRNSKDLDELEKSLADAELRIKVLTEGEEGDWAPGDVTNLGETLRRAYETLVQEDVVKTAVEQLEGAIEEAIYGLSSSPATSERLKRILVVPVSDEEDSEDD